MRLTDLLCRLHLAIALVLALVWDWLLGPVRRRRPRRTLAAALGTIAIVVGLAGVACAQAIDNLPKAPDPAKLPEIENAAAFLKAGKAAFEVVPKVVSLLELVQYCHGAKDAAIAAAVLGVIAYLWFTRNQAAKPPRQV